MVKKRVEKKINLKILIWSILAVFATSIIGSSFTSTTTGSWYQSVKPAITPPNWIFPVVWTILYIMIAIAMWLSISNSIGKTRNKLIALFAINLVLNALWSIFFFGMQNPTLAFIDLILMWISTLVLIKITWKIDKKSSWILLPYALWITFAGLLNYLIAFG